MRGLASTPSRNIPTYEQFYGFHHTPFSLSPDPQFLYLSDSHDEALRLLLKSVQQNGAFNVLTGDAGTGKTTLSRALVDQLDATTFTSLISSPLFSVEELLREVLHDFGIISADDVRSGRVAAAGAKELTRTLHEFLSSIAPLGGKAVLIIDEAQRLPPGLLEQIYALSDVEADTARLLRIVLVGEPRLLDALSSPEMLSLNQRISLRVALRPLTRPETEAYVEHRLAVAHSDSPVRFEGGAVDTIYGLTGGVPQLVNVLGDRALMLGAQWSADVITTAMVEDAARLADLRRPAPAAVARTSAVSPWWVVGAVALVLLSSAIALVPLHRFVDAPVPPAPRPPQIRVAAPLQPLPVPVDVPPPPPRPRPLPAF